MKKVLLSAILLVLGLFDVDAQTLKNIHRKNLPKLQVPTHLIDKVETVLDSNIRKLKVTQTSGFVSLIPTADIDSITHSEGQAVNPEQLGNLRTGRVFGVVRNDQGNPIPMALVKSAYSPHQTTTDSNGVFFLNNFVVYDKLGFITVEKAGYFKGSRSFLPLENGANRVEIQLLTKTQSGSFNSSSGGQITAGSLQLTFPANAIVQANGQAYTGTVNVFASALDPSAQEMFDQMPGDLLGGMNDSLRLLHSFGMAAVELFGSNNEPLQLVAGQNATLRFTIPESILSEAPESIDWWSFDEEAGYWKHEGTAQKAGNEYLGQASHFSWWNVDIPRDFVEFIGVVNDTSNNSISGARIEVETQTLGTGIKYTNTEGVFSGYVPVNHSIELNIKLKCPSTNDWVLAHSENLQIQISDINQQFIASLNQFYPITGTVVNCNGQPVSSGYIRIGSQFFFTSNGTFTIQTCATGNYIIRAYDTSNPNNVKVGLPISIQVTQSGVTTGNLEACEEIFGTVTDIDGNIYQTVVIGNQTWMAENLKATRFSNGDIIPNITENLEWVQLTTPAWCLYENNPANNFLYGKLYNWFVASDPRNVCPIGWHVPSYEELNILVEYLGGEGIAGAKMKSTNGWNSPNVGATNETGFTGLPGGLRADSNGLFDGIGVNGEWWTSSDSDIYVDPWFYALINDELIIFIFNFSNQHGMSIRCVID